MSRFYAAWLRPYNRVCFDQLNTSDAQRDSDIELASFPTAARCGYPGGGPHLCMDDLYVSHSVGGILIEGFSL